jgi:hypothetical protein
MAVTYTGLSGGMVNGYRKFAEYYTGNREGVVTECRVLGGSDFFYFDNTARMYELRACKSDGSFASVLQYGRLSTENAPLSVLILQFLHTAKYRCIPGIKIVTPV